MSGLEILEELDQPTRRTPNESEERAKELGARDDNTIVIIHPPHVIPNSEKIFIAEIVRPERVGIAAGIKRALSSKKRTPFFMNMPQSARQSVERRHRQSYESCHTQTMHPPQASRRVKGQTRTWIPPVEVDDFLPDIQPSPKAAERMKKIEEKKREEELKKTLNELELLFETPPNFSDPSILPSVTSINGGAWVDLNDLEKPE